MCTNDFSYEQKAVVWLCVVNPRAVAKARATQSRVRKGPGKQGHIVADAIVSPFARARNICCGQNFFVLGTKNDSDFVQNTKCCPKKCFFFSVPNLPKLERTRMDFCQVPSHN